MHNWSLKPTRYAAGLAPKLGVYLRGNFAQHAIGALRLCQRYSRIRCKQF